MGHFLVDYCQPLKWNLFLFLATISSLSHKLLPAHSTRLSHKSWYFALVLFILEFGTRPVQPRINYPSWYFHLCSSSWFRGKFTSNLSPILIFHATTCWYSRKQFEKGLAQVDPSNDFGIQSFSNPISGLISVHYPPNIEKLTNLNFALHWLMSPFCG